MTNFHIPPDLDAPLDELAASLREDKEALVNRAVREFVEREAPTAKCRQETPPTARTHPDLDARLDELAARRREDKEALVDRAVRVFVEREALEEKRWQETLPALESARAGRVSSLEEVEKWVRSLGTDNELPRPGSK